MSTSSKALVAYILRTVPNQNAFQFYTGIGVPTQLHAENLESFLETTKIANVSSIEFHMNRGDFANWFKMLGDDLLFRQLVNLQKKDLEGEALRKRLLQILRLRYGKLRKLALKPSKTYESPTMNI